MLCAMYLADYFQWYKHISLTEKHATVCPTNWPLYRGVGDEH